MEKTLQKRLSVPLIAAALVAGIGAGAFALAGAQSAAAAETASTTVASTASAGATGAGAHGHAPIGNDGIVASINGTTLMMTEEADEGGATYTVDASSATVTKDGASGTLASIAVGDKIFVTGTVTGTNVVATNVNDGHGGPNGGHRGPPPASTTGTTQ